MKFKFRIKYTIPVFTIFDSEESDVLHINADARESTRSQLRLASPDLMRYIGAEYKEFDIIPTQFDANSGRIIDRKRKSNDREREVYHVLCNVTFTRTLYVEINDMEFHKKDKAFEQVVEHRDYKLFELCFDANLPYTFDVKEL